MIELELRTFPAGARDPVRVAGLTIEDDGTYRVDDPKELLPTAMPVFSKSPDGGYAQVFLEQDPAAWARGLRTVMRSGYLFPVIVRDDEKDIDDG